MTDHSANPNRAASDNDQPRLDRAALIRCAADDCLTPEQAEALRLHLKAHPQDRARIESERALRNAVARAMDTGPAPDDLRRAAERAIAQRHVADTVGPVQTRQRSFWRRTPPIPAAIAAMLLIATGAFYLTLPPPPPGPAIYGVQSVGERAVQWVASEHDKCRDSDEYRQRKLSVVNVADVRERTQRDLGVAPNRIQLDDAGYAFAGYGPCHIPGGGASGQLIYNPVSGQGEPISLFVQRDEGQLEDVIRTSECLLSVNSGADNGNHVFAWRADGLIYYLVAPGHGSQASPCLKSLGAPSNRVSL